MTPEYDFQVSEDKQSCKIFLKPHNKYLGEVVAAPGGRCLQTFASGVMWLPFFDALGAMEAMTKEKVTLGKLGFH